MNGEFTFKEIIFLAVPAIVSQAVIVFVALIGQLFIGQFGALAISAVSISNNSCFAIYNFLEGIRTGTNVLTAKYLGAKNEKNIAGVLFLSLISAILVGGIVIIYAFFIKLNFSKIDPFYLIGNQQLRAVGDNFLFASLLGAPFVLIFFAITGFFRGLKDSINPLHLTLVVVVVDIILNYLFIMGFGGYFNFKLGVFGAALASFLSYVLGAVFCFIFLFRKKLTKKYTNFVSISSDLRKEYIKLVVEIGAYAGLLMLAFMFFIKIFQHLDAVSFASFNIIFNILIIISLPPMGFLIAAVTMASKFAGEDRLDLIKPLTYKISLIALIFSSFFSLMLLCFPSYVAYLFSPKDLHVQALTARTLWFVAGTNIFSTVYLVLRGILTGIKDTRFIVFEGLFSSFVLFLPTAYFLGIKMHFGLWGGYAAYFVWTIADCLFFSWRFFVVTKKKDL
ncbi:TPA: hypothetical protein DEO28_01195 [Candidatus Dependentiae bacterium]|nr:MAG: MATE efflux family protein [candidate division TM6 bacterium GW2011_GWE2_31_21]KKP53747.1 MAG: MATE efflux family protein [candidate division TM6 bacterium GW2011_GWF2_33_332]HBS48499.1 hypothetical protein [Candidatus Dependentiae bacterium]HBZ73114.1 hypothetical protein [Candidatus Dependentiae bacterium]